MTSKLASKINPIVEIFILFLVYFPAMRTEIELPTGIANINKNNSGASIEIGGFKATLQELKTLEMLSRGMNRQMIAEELGISINRARRIVENVISRNTQDFTGFIPNVSEIISEASHHELLNRISIIGIEAVVAKEEAKLQAIRECVLPKSIPTEPKSKENEYISIDVWGMDKVRLQKFAEEQLKILVTHGKYPQDVAEKLREYVLLLLQGERIPKTQIKMDGLDFRKVLSQATNHLLEYQNQQRELTRKIRKFDY
jgi:hypothetical protein